MLAHNNVLVFNSYILASLTITDSTVTISRFSFTKSQLASFSWAAALLQPAGQLVFEGLVSVATARGEATDGPVHRPGHLHLLGQLRKPHHQLDKQRAASHTSNLRVCAGIWQLAARERNLPGFPRSRRPWG